MNRITPLFLFVFAESISGYAQTRFDSTSIIGNLAPTVEKLQVIAKNTAVHPTDAKNISLPGAEKLNGVFKTSNEVLGTKRMERYGWRTTIAGGTDRFNELDQLYKAACAEMNRAFPGAYRPNTSSEWLVDSTFTVTIQLVRGTPGYINRDWIDMWAFMYRDVQENTQLIADSFRLAFYDRLQSARGTFGGQETAVGILYWNLKHAALPAEIVNDTYYKAAKEKAANDPQLAYILLRTHPADIPTAHIRNALTPETIAAAEDMMKRADAMTLAAAKKKEEEQAAGQKAAPATTPAVPVVPGTTYTISKVVIYKSQPTKSYVLATNGAIITSRGLYQRDLQVGDNVFADNSLKAVSQVFGDYVRFSDNSSVRRDDWTVYVIRGVGLRRNVAKLNCTVCNNQPVTVGSAPVNVVTGYKTHTYNTSGQTYNVISTPTTTQVGSVRTTNYCKACNGKGGTNVDQTKVELFD